MTATRLFIVHSTKALKAISDPNPKVVREQRHMLKTIFNKIKQNIVDLNFSERLIHDFVCETSKWNPITLGHLFILVSQLKEIETSWQ